MKTLLFIFCLLLAFSAQSANDERYSLHVDNPERDIGHIVGDRITRTVVLDVQPPYALASASLPAKGLNRQGIELHDIELHTSSSSGATRYTVRLDYQVFTRAVTPRKVALPQETLQLKGNSRTIKVMIPAWSFRVSPLAAQGETHIEQDMSPFRGPMLREAKTAQQLLAACIALIAFAAGGLLYFNGNRRWLPGMGGPFAAASRQLRRLPVGDTQQAVAAIHQAFKRTFGANLFKPDLPKFFAAHPRFVPVRQEIEDFFRLSDGVLFGAAATDSYTPHKLRHFCNLCRDCEREPFALPPLTAVTVSSIVLTLAIVLLMQKIEVLPMWPLVIAWACFFHLGGGEKPRAAVVSVFVSTVFGVLMGWLSALAIMSNPIPELMPGTIWAALVIALAVGIISVCAYWKTLSITPVCIYGYAATWGYLDVPGRFDWAVLTALDWQNVVLVLPAAIAVGCAFAYVNARMVGMLVRSAP
ncbi:DUF1097 domain-containing protein [Methylobacillus sp. MM3]|uniref:DUF1097 domain-containing protein n=1 Tax=Methylobacillus sp. MM3 TaxID=1848039 RepID=UPI000A3E5534|nr:DUF1097 domain-containing protein [Methylobacillus sp. MM3]